MGVNGEQPKNCLELFHGAKPRASLLGHSLYHYLGKRQSWPQRTCRLSRQNSGITRAQKSCKLQLLLCPALSPVEASLSGDGSRDPAVPCWILPSAVGGRMRFLMGGKASGHKVGPSPSLALSSPPPCVDPGRHGGLPKLGLPPTLCHSGRGPPVGSWMGRGFASPEQHKGLGRFLPVVWGWSEIPYARQAEFQGTCVLPFLASVSKYHAAHVSENL